MATQRQALTTYASIARMYVRTHSPGDGVTRYRFFKRARCSACLDVPGKDGLGDPCQVCTGDGYMGETNGYFGPDNGVFTALGIREALTFINGVLAGCRGQTPMRHTAPRATV